MPKILRIGTRGSLLAKTQCQQTQANLERDTQQKYELEFIKTQGDLQTEKPLWQMDGKDFFTKELDTALLKDDVQLVVHSYKDLGSERPAGIKLGAITERKFSNDILLIKKSTVATLASLDELEIGTSSPRRIYNIENYLSEYIPAKKNVAIKTKMLRGNINTRIQKLKDDQYHGIVLALAGIERLALTEESALELKKLLEGLTFMVLPQSIFPAAASQGALGIEYNEKSPTAEETKKFLATQNHQDTIDEVSKERVAFQSYGGGCHLAVGINVIKIKNHFLHIHRGISDDKKIDICTLERPEEMPALSGKLFVGLAPEKLNQFGDSDLVADSIIDHEPITGDCPDSGNFYITSNYCFDLFQKSKNPTTIWSSGSKTMKKLATAGYWVNGTADSLGDEALVNLKSSRAISMMIPQDEWFTLTHTSGYSDVGKVLPAYDRVLELQVPDHYPQAMKECSAFYWSSFFQYQTHLQLYPEIKDRIHCCGLGKTYDQFLKNQIKVYPFAKMKDFIDARK